MLVCAGISFSASGFLIPQLEDPAVGFGITRRFTALLFGLCMDIGVVVTYFLGMSQYVQGELLPVKARSLGIGCLGFIVSLISFGLVKSIPNMFATIGIHGTFLMCACFAIFTMIFSFFFMPETFGLTLEEIEDLYRQENPISGEKKH